MRVCSCLFLILILLHIGCTMMRCFIFTIQGLMYGESYESVFIFFNLIAGRMCHDEVFFFTIQGLIPHESVHWNV